MHRLQFAFTSNDFFVFVTADKCIEFTKHLYASDKPMSIVNPDFDMFKYLCSLDDNSIDDFLYSIYHGILTQETGSDVFCTDKSKLLTLSKGIIKYLQPHQRDEKILELTKKLWLTFKDNRSDDVMLEIMYDKLSILAKTVDISVFSTGYHIEI